jgi:Family of unknown function (DUF6151)
MGPLIGGMFLTGALLVSPVTRRYAWLGFVIDPGSLFLFAATLIFFSVRRRRAQQRREIPNGVRSLPVAAGIAFGGLEQSGFLLGRDVRYDARMAMDIPLRCDCGKVRGVAANVAPSTGLRMVCYCDDCQAFAHFLERRDVLDQWGGSDVFALAPRSLRITDGVDQLRCVRLSPKGTFRWYAGCCRTPIGNSIGPHMPFIGLIHSFMDHRGDGRTRDAALGKPAAYVQGRFAIGGTPPHAHPSSPLGVVLRALGFIARWLVTGKGTPSPFYDASKRPIVAPKVLTADERAAVYQRVRDAGAVVA